MVQRTVGGRLHQSGRQSPVIETHQHYKAELPKLGKQLRGMVQQPEQGQGTDDPAQQYVLSVTT